MNRKRVTALLIAEAVLCLWLAWAYGSGGDILAAALAFPFAALGRTLRWMSLAGTVQAAGVLSQRCAVSLSAAVLASVAFHLLQLAFMSRLHTTSFSLNIPLASLTLVIGTLLLAQYLREGKRLKDDNDLFI